MMVIGLTGGVGAGKSRILSILRAEYGAEVIVADEVAHELMEPGQPGYDAVVSALGAHFLNEDASINKKKLGEIIFNDEGALQTMNSIVHPMVWKMIEKKISASQAGLIVVESAIMGREQRKTYDEIWYVYTSEANRLERLLANRGYTMEHSRSIMAHQLSDAEFRNLCDRVIDNNGSFDEVSAQIKSIFELKG